MTITSSFALAITLYLTLILTLILSIVLTLTLFLTLTPFYNYHNLFLNPTSIPILTLAPDSLTTISKQKSNPNTIIHINTFLIPDLDLNFLYV
jgi:hypothetical protein